MVPKTPKASVALSLKGNKTMPTTDEIAQALLANKNKVVLFKYLGGDKPTVVDGRAFKCPKCKCQVLEEVMCDVYQSSNIIQVTDGEAEYGNTSTDGGVVNRIQCLECGHRVAGDYQELTILAKDWKK